MDKERRQTPPTPLPHLLSISGASWERTECISKTPEQANAQDWELGLLIMVV